MKKLLFILVSIVFISCSSRKVLVDKTDIKKDSIAETKVVVTKIDTTNKTDSTKVVINTDSSEVIITPIDSSKTIIVDGKSYKNVVLKIKKNKSNTLYTNNKKESNIKRIDSVATSKVETKEHQVEKTKIIDKEQNYWSFFWWILLILIIYLLWRNKPWLLNVL
jgi:ATP-dependent Zn protease